MDELLRYREYFYLAVIALLAIALAAFWLSRYRRRRRQLQQLRRGLVLEGRAKRVLERHGYVVVDAQAEFEHVFKVDGSRRTARLTVDYVATKHGRRYLVEVKSGRSVNSVDNRHTRRQLLEYDHAIDNDGLILVDMESEMLHKIEFPGRPNRQQQTSCIAASCVMAATGIAAIFSPTLWMKIAATGIILLCLCFIVGCRK